jgi:hypothetical protein
VTVALVATSLLSCGGRTELDESGNPSRPEPDSGRTCFQTCSGTCSQGGCVVALASVGIPGAIAIDSANAYFTDFNSNGVMSVPLGGGTPTLLATDPNGPVCVTVSGGVLYWGSYAAVNAVPSAGGPFAVLAAAEWPTGLAAEGGRLYWTSFNGDNGSGPIETVAINGGPVEGIVPSLGEGRGGIALDANFVYWADRDNGAIWKVSRTGGTPQALYSRMTSSVWSLAIDAAYAYFPDASSGTLWKVSLSGGEPLAVVSNTGVQSDDNVAVDATHLYYTDSGEGALVRVPLGGGAPSTLASEQSFAIGSAQILAISGSRVYWLTDDEPSNSGNVMSFTPTCACL